MQFSIIGLNFKTAPVELREKLSFPQDQIPEALDILENNAGIAEAVILSTCNRVEIYVASEDVDVDEKVIHFMAQYHGIAAEDFRSNLYMHKNEEAVEHIFSVSGSLMSMVIGENQIQNQLKTALEMAQGNQTVGAYLSTIFQNALKVGKRVRNETSISEHSLSISSVAVAALKRNIFSFSDKTICVIGLGKMSMLAIKALQKLEAKEIIVVNRTLSTAEAFAKNHNITVKPFSQLKEALVQCDAVISSTSSPNYVITTELMAQAQTERLNKTLTLVDIAVPRDIEPSAAKLEGVNLLNIDELKDAIAVNKEKRGAEIEKARIIIKQEIDKHRQWQQALQVQPLICELKNDAEKIREQELQRAICRFNRELSEEDSELLHDLTRRIVNKMLHKPIINLRAGSKGSNPENYASIVRELFDIKTATL